MLRPLAYRLQQPFALQVQQPLGGQEVLEREVVKGRPVAFAGQQDAGSGQQVHDVPVGMMFVGFIVLPFRD